MDNQLMTYRGYQGSAEVSLEDNCLHGVVVGITDLVTYEAATVEGLRAAFENAVDNYLQQCADLSLVTDQPGAADPALRRP